ncbi:MAG TPA: hypothetical protein PLY96_02280 [Chromatiaceae bacterium]|nr:hypothetical protein [Chromatiaceae bacterium]
MSVVSLFRCFGMISAASSFIASSVIGGPIADQQLLAHAPAV